MNNLRTNFILILILLWALVINAQTHEKFIRVVVAPDHPDWMTV